MLLKCAPSYASSDMTARGKRKAGAIARLFVFIANDFRLFINDIEQDRLSAANLADNRRIWLRRAALAAVLATVPDNEMWAMVRSAARSNFFSLALIFIAP